MKLPEDGKRISITKIPGEKWTITFTGKITRRELNHLRRLLPVEYSRMGRRRQMKRLQDERIERAEKARVPIMEESSVETNTVKVDPVLKTITKESSDDAV